MNSIVDKVGRLTIFRAERLGTGRFGSVFPGKIKGFVEEVAIKLIEKKKFQIDSNLYIQVNRNPNLIRYYGTDYSTEDDKFMYLAIEYCMGTLEDLVCGGYEDFAMTDQSHLPVLYQITAGLYQLHSLGIVHGNLKPSNILVSFPKGKGSKPTMKLADFGIRHAVRDEAIGLTRFRLVTTEGWMCPVDSQDPIRPSFDLFSLGCICGFIVLNGRHPFGTDPISAIKNRQPIQMSIVQGKSNALISAFFDLITRMLKFDAKIRPSTIDALKQIIIIQQSSKSSSSHGPTHSTTSPLVLQETPGVVEVEPQIVDSWCEIEPDSHREELFDSDYVSEANSSSSSPPPNKKNKAVTYPLFKKPQTQTDDEVKMLEDLSNPHSSSKGKEQIRIRFTIKPKPNPIRSTLVSHLSSAFRDGLLVSSSTNNQEPDGSQSTPFVSETETLFICDICRYCCASKSVMTSHINTHTGAKPFECKVCLKRFAQPKTLHFHLKTHLRPQFKCDFCPKMFNQKHSKNQHMNTHTGARPFECEQCDQRFSSKSGRNRHEQTHSAPKYDCPYCHKMFSHSFDRRRHWLGDSNGRIACQVRRKQLVNESTN